MNVVLSIPARMKSARLPGKVLAPIDAGGETHPMLWYQVQRLRKANAELVIATTEDPSDDPIAAFARDMKMRCVRGSTSDLIARHAKVARETNADVFVLSGADDPLLEASLVDACAAKVGGSIRYAYSVGWPLGMNCWAWDRQGMEEADAEATDADEREHVVPWFGRRPERYPAGRVVRDDDVGGFYHTHRLTVDFPVDLELMRRIIGTLWPMDPDFDLEMILTLLNRHPHWLALNNRAPQYFYDLTPVQEKVNA